MASGNDQNAFNKHSDLFCYLRDLKKKKKFIGSRQVLPFGFVYYCSVPNSVFQQQFSNILISKTYEIPCTHMHFLEWFLTTQLS